MDTNEIGTKPHKNLFKDIKIRPNYNTNKPGFVFINYEEEREPLWKIVTGGIMLIIIAWILAVAIMAFF